MDQFQYFLFELESGSKSAQLKAITCQDEDL